MGKIIKLVNVNEQGHYTKETYQFLLNRVHDYINFISSESPEDHRDMWCEKLIKVLKFLGDYKIDEELEEDFYLTIETKKDKFTKINKTVPEISNNYKTPTCKANEDTDWNKVFNLIYKEPNFLGEQQ